MTREIAHSATAKPAFTGVKAQLVSQLMRASKSGLSKDELVERVGISHKTIHVHLTAIGQKLLDPSFGRKYPEFAKMRLYALGRYGLHRYTIKKEVANADGGATGKYTTKEKTPFTQREQALFDLMVNAPPEGMAWEELAERSGSTLGTVRTIVSQIAAKLESPVFVKDFPHLNNLAVYNTGKFGKRRFHIKKLKRPS